MNIFLKNIFFNTAFNVTLFLLLMIGIQNTNKSHKVNLFLVETIQLPIGFIVGISFISGSITGSFLNLDINIKK